MQRRMGTKMLMLVCISFLINVVLVVWVCVHSQRLQLQHYDYNSRVEYHQYKTGVRELMFQFPAPHDGLTSDRSFTDINSKECSIHGVNQSSLSSLRILGSSLRTIVPPPDKFLPQFRNPCWYMNIHMNQYTNKLLHKTNITESVASQITSTLFRTRSKTLVCMPKVFFIGFPRSGSTQLYKMLIKHPQLIGGDNKEPHWWTKSQFNEKFPYNILTVVRYLSHYHEASQSLLQNRQSLLIDGSQSTVWDTRNTKNLCVLPQLITSVVPEAKFIVLMRNPVQRLLSDTKYLCEEQWGVRKNGTIPPEYFNTATDTFLRNAQAEIEDFQKCLLIDNLDTCTHHALDGLKGVLDYKCGRVRLGISLYHVHIRRWLNVIARERFLFLQTDELAKDPLEVLQRVWTFLDVPVQSKEELSGILYEHLHSSQHQSETDENFKFLDRFFQPHNQELAKLLQDDKFSWNQ